MKSKEDQARDWTEGTTSDAAISAAVHNKRKHFLASAGLLYAPICTPLSRHLLSDLSRLSSGKEREICSKCNCLFMRDSCRAIIDSKPKLKKTVKKLRNKPRDLLTSLERKKLRRWQTRRCKVVVHCNVCKQTAVHPGPTAVKPFFRKEHHLKQLPGRNFQNRRLHKPPKGRFESRGEKKAKMAKVKQMLKGDKQKKSKASQSPLLKFLSSI